MRVVPADKVISLFGSERAVAELLGLSVVQIYRWTYPKEKRGHDGRVPDRHHAKLIAEAKRRGKRLTIADLNPPDMPPLGKPGPKPRAATEAA